MGIEENKANIRRQVQECWNKGNFSAVTELISPDFLYHTPMGDLIGHEGFIQLVTIWRTACPDIEVTINELVGEGDSVAVRLSWEGTFTGKFQDSEPTGNKVKMEESFYHHFKEGKDLGPIVYANHLSLFQQMGINPTN